MDDVSATPIDASAAERAESHITRLRRDMVRGSLWTALTSLAVLPTSLIANIIVAHGLGPSQLGRFAILGAGYGLLGGLLNFGWSNATVQWLAAASATARHDDQVDLIRRCAGYHTFVEGPLLAVATAFYLRDQPPLLIVVASATVFLIQVAGTSTVILTATARNALGAKLSFLVTIVSQAGVASTASATHSGTRTWLAQLVVSLLGPLLVFAFIGPRFRRALLRPRVGRGNPAGFLAYSASACGAGVIGGLALGRSELFVLHLDHLGVATGLFTLATGLAGQITVPMDSLMAPLVPTAAALVASASDLAVQRMLKAIRVTSMLGAFTASVGVPVGCIALPYIYGDSYAEAQGAFVALAVVSCVQSVVVPVDAFALATRSAALVLRTNIICLVVDAGLAIALIPFIGLAGAVIANSVTQLLSLVLLVRIVKRRLNVTGSQIARAAQIFAVGPVAASTALIPFAVGAPTLVSLVLAVVLGAGIVLLALRLVPSLRLRADDVATIEAGMPRRLSLAFALLTRIGALAEPAGAGVPRP